MKIEAVLSVLSEGDHPVKKQVGGLAKGDMVKANSGNKDFSVSLSTSFSGRDNPGTFVISQKMLPVYEKPKIDRISLPQRGYGFQVDVNNESVMVVTDKESGKVVKQIPTEEQQRIDASLDKLKETLQAKQTSPQATNHLKL